MRRFRVGLTLLFALAAMACGSRTIGVGSPSPTPYPTPTPTVGATAAIRAEGLRQLLDESGRSVLRVCVFVDPTTSASPAQSAALFDGTLAQLAASLAPPVAIDRVVACGGPPVFIATNSRHMQNSASTLPAGEPARVTKGDVSPETLMVVVTSRARLDAIFGSLTTRRGAEQMLCDGGNCFEVTTSLYIEESALGDADARRRALLEGLGFAGRS